MDDLRGRVHNRMRFFTAEFYLRSAEMDDGTTALALGGYAPTRPPITLLSSHILSALRLVPCLRRFLTLFCWK